MTASLMAGGSPQTTRWQVGGALSQLPEAEHSRTEGPCKLGKNGYYSLPWRRLYTKKGSQSASVTEWAKTTSQLMQNKMGSLVLEEGPQTSPRDYVDEKGLTGWLGSSHNRDRHPGSQGN